MGKRTARLLEQCEYLAQYGAFVRARKAIDMRPVQQDANEASLSPRSEYMSGLIRSICLESECHGDRNRFKYPGIALMRSPSH